MMRQFGLDLKVGMNRRVPQEISTSQRNLATSFNKQYHHYHAILMEYVLVQHFQKSVWKTGIFFQQNSIIIDTYIDDQMQDPCHRMSNRQWILQRPNEG
jgi:hypothetical protein